LAPVGRRQYASRDQHAEGRNQIAQLGYNRDPSIVLCGVIGD